MSRLIIDVATNEQTVVELTAKEIGELEAAETARIAAIPYTEKRREAYPSIPDQLDLLFHGGYDAWRAAIQAVKDEYPKE